MANRPEEQGCLSILFPFLRRKQQTVTYDVTTEEELPYRLRDDFLSLADFFYKVLSTVVGSRFAIQFKVRLVDIFFVPRPNENYAYFNKISRRHVDFLICYSSSMKPLLGVELDDTSHRKSDRQMRDEFLDDVFRAEPELLDLRRCMRRYT